MDDYELADACFFLWEDVTLDDDERLERAEAIMKEQSPNAGPEQILRVCSRCDDLVRKRAADREKIEKRKAAEEAEKAKETAAGPSTTSSSQGAPAGFSFNVGAAEFRPGQPLPPRPLTDEEKREAYRIRKAHVDAAMGRADTYIADLQKKINGHDAEIKRLEAVNASALDAVNRRLPLIPTGEPEQQEFLARAAEAEDRAGELKEEKARLMNEKLAAQEERNLLHEEMWPQKGELLPDE
ncbi:MAG: hypothetical protein Q9208_000626 [Pyrenodesmia sp. 3 TL-2023]